jgi:hypothetical protein
LSTSQQSTLETQDDSHTQTQTKSQTQTDSTHTCTHEHTEVLRVNDFAWDMLDFRKRGELM